MGTGLHCISNSGKPPISLFVPCCVGTVIINTVHYKTCQLCLSGVKYENTLRKKPVELLELGILGTHRREGVPVITVTLLRCCIQVHSFSSVVLLCL
ncbi:hypothetical protein GDO86_010410 [Hymenochirus boettgeri]|uniref:Uncharacterized protein n=1 Tax=Hymenochirus boettgeri TaxID=247094 RepID=A0A8T2JPD3_9PIPI|nr:hypothetical protein GDO86_010410 [Hymenochirus boettgeri]